MAVRRVRLQHRKGEAVAVLIEEFNKLIGDLAPVAGVTLTASRIADSNGRDSDGATVADAGA